MRWAAAIQNGVAVIGTALDRCFRRRRRGSPPRLLAVAAGCFYQLCTLGVAAQADDLALVSKLGEFQKVRGLVSTYSADEENHSLDLTIIPATPLASGEASATGRATCALGIRGLGGNLAYRWTVRVFVQGQAAPAFSCEIPATPKRSRRRSRR